VSEASIEALSERFDQFIQSPGARWDEWCTLREDIVSEHAAAPAQSPYVGAGRSWSLQPVAVNLADERTVQGEAVRSRLLRFGWGVSICTSGSYISCGLAIGTLGYRLCRPAPAALGFVSSFGLERERVVRSGHPLEIEVR
jgi:hypothetical protein